MKCEENVMDKNKPVQYIYILEYPNGDTATRRTLTAFMEVIQ
jgi:hypothetical protein